MTVESLETPTETTKSWPQNEHGPESTSAHAQVATWSTHVPFADAGGSANAPRISVAKQASSNIELRSMVVGPR
jgi:hypothetical protein